MKQPPTWLRISYAFAVVSLAGCGGGGGGGDVASPPAPAPSVAAPSPAAASSFMYALDSDAAVVRVLRADATTGALTPVAGAAATAAASGRPVDLAVTPNRERVVVVSRNGTGAGALRAFRIAASGEQLAALGAAVSVGAQPTAVTVTGDGRYVYVSHAQGIDGFAFDAAGALQRLAGSPFPTGYSAMGATIDPATQREVLVPGVAITDRPAIDLVQAGNVLFAATNKGSVGEVSTLSAGNDGVLNPVHTGVAQCAVGRPAMGGTFSASGSGTIALGIARGVVYSLNRDSNSIAAHRYGSSGCIEAIGWMVPVTGSPFATGTRPSALAVDPLGAFVYAAHTGGAAGQVSVYAIQASGALTPVRGSPFPLAMVPARMWMDNGGSHLYTSDTVGNVDVLTIDRDTGAPGPARSTLLGNRAHVVVQAPSP